MKNLLYKPSSGRTQLSRYISEEVLIPPTRVVELNQSWHSFDRLHFWTRLTCIPVNCTIFLFQTAVLRIVPLLKVYESNVYAPVSRAAQNRLSLTPLSGAKTMKSMVNFACMNQTATREFLRSMTSIKSEVRRLVNINRPPLWDRVEFDISS